LHKVCFWGMLSIRLEITMTDISDINEYFREALLKTVPCAVFMVDSDNKIIFWNKSAEELTQYSSDEVVGYTCDKLRVNICANQPCRQKDILSITFWG